MAVMRPENLLRNIPFNPDFYQKKFRFATTWQR